jgi:class 3 adenylate cyclase
VSRTLVRSFSSPDEHRDFPGGILDLVSVGALAFGREILQPGWRWSQDVRPIAGTDRCEFHHVGYTVSGRWVCEDRDGSQTEIGPGEIYDTPPGHDAWVIGDEPCIMIDFQGIEDWAAQGAARRVLTTVLFADVVDSTATIDRIGDAAWRHLQAQLFENIRSVLSTQDGLLVNTAGDGILARFESPVAAVRAAARIARAGERIGLAIRGAVHTGEVEETGTNLTGMAVHVAARLLALADPGQVLVTSTTRDLTLDAGLVYEERGEAELKGVPGARRLYALRPE